jgi:hypothetical protein
MLAYVRDEIIIATHLDSQDVDPKLYGPDVYVVPFPNNTAFERIGDPPPNGEYDSRPQKIPTPDLSTLKNYAANKRRQMERSGLVTTASGFAYRTDTDSRAALAVASLHMQRDLATKVNWKLPSGEFVQIDFAEIDRALVAVSQFIEDAFTREKNAFVSIIDGTSATYASVDAFFPA